jgi:hypothetical protein
VCVCVCVWERDCVYVCVRLLCVGVCMLCDCSCVYVCECVCVYLSVYGCVCVVCVYGCACVILCVFCVCVCLCVHVCMSMHVVCVCELCLLIRQQTWVCAWNVKLLDVSLRIRISCTLYWLPIAASCAHKRATFALSHLLLSYYIPFRI